ncbi:type II and III secretion system protein family protein [Salinarimonas sp.]|uniref:type II and III secretion system protein family protein n=1 Tax=Salinarimonas sp. TaxID=2766526 RepID=UPI0035B548FB
MRPTPPRRPLATALASAALILGLGAAPTAAPAADWDRAAPGIVAPHVASSAPIVRIGAGEGAVARRVDVAVGKSVIVELPADAREVFVANPAVANAVVRSTRKIFLIGQAAGATSVFAFDAEGRQIASLDVDVGRDLVALRDTLRRTLPGSTVEVQAAGESIVLTGAVSSALEAQRAVDIAQAFVGVSEGTAGAVVNSLTIGGEDQVMLRVTVVEVERSVLKRFGIETNAGWTPNPVGGFEGLTLSSSGTGGEVRAGLQGGGFSLEATLDAFESVGLLRVLAEPTLVAISGETADFQAGGQIPIRSCSGTGATLECGIELLDFGVNLSFTPVVLSSGRISLRVATRVREIDPSVSVEIGGSPYPGFKTRESATSLELGSGATIMTAGLLSQRMDRRVNGFPGLLNVPILGALFRSTAYERRETELMILVTPYIAQPMQPTEVARPDDGFVDAYDPQTVLLGRLNQIYGTAGPVDPIGLRGTFGFIAD